ncbi:MAG: acireductone synthase, partial [Cyanobacteriota bacterium]
MSIKPRHLSHLLLDIEGTTCPVNYVTGVLFPYASRSVTTYLEAHSEDNDVRNLLTDITQAWENDDSAYPRELFAQRKHHDPIACIPYIQWLIQEDRKLTALKDLQGKIWDEGYKRGDLVAPLFADVADTLKAWKNQGMIINSYSSGSLQAHKLLYQHSTSGDLRFLFSHWFDTSIGNKKEAISYQQISLTMGTEPSM